MKRFTETDKWRQAWYRQLSPVQKCLWSYLQDNCDAAGVVELDHELAAFQIGETVKESDYQALAREITMLPNGRFFIHGFIQAQYGKLSQDCKPHMPVFAALSKHGIDPNDVAQNGQFTNSLDGYLRTKIIERDGLLCAYFNTPVDPLKVEIDHVIPRSLGGTATPDNLVVCCHEANAMKCDLSLSEFCTKASLDFSEIEKRVSDRISKPIKGYQIASQRLQDKKEKRIIQANARDPSAVTPEMVYAAYPRKEAKQDALKAIAKVAQETPLESVLEATQAYAAAVAKWPQDDLKFVPHPATWFNGGRFSDDRSLWVRVAPNGRPPAPPPRPDIYTEPAGWRDRAKTLWPGVEMPATWGELSSTARNDLLTQR